MSPSHFSSPGPLRYTEGLRTPLTPSRHGLDVIPLPPCVPQLGCSSTRTCLGVLMPLTTPRLEVTMFLFNSLVSSICWVLGRFGLNTVTHSGNKAGNPRPLTLQVSPTPSGRHGRRARTPGAAVRGRHLRESDPQ